MNNTRMLQLEQHLDLLRQQQASLEKEAILLTGLPKTQAEQRLELDVKPQIRKYEEEFWRILAGEVKCLDIPEKEAEIVVAEIVEQVGQIEVSNTNYSDEILKLLREIRDQLNKPGSSAAAKLKGVISSVPPFFGISYEAELDTENFFRSHFPTFTSLIRRTIKK
jgi:hypothetical protein